MSIKEFMAQMSFKGWYSFPEFVGSTLVERMKYDLEQSYIMCRKIQEKNGIENTENTAHHIVGHAKSFMDYLTKFEELNSYVEAYFGGKYILNSFGGNILKKGTSYANKIHRDIRNYSKDIPLMLNTIVFLEDFSQDNGATWLMEKGHLLADKPTKEEFDKSKFQIIGKAGTVYVWNSNLWHQAGENKTDQPRRSLTPEFTRPFIKQGFDYCRALGKEKVLEQSEYIKQLLGHYSRTPSSLEEWYRKPQDRLYMGNQG